ncbi:hypothetical protein CC86DRAFT_248941, partial [Ophiobolus disseminans]
RHDWEPIRAIHDDRFKHVATMYTEKPGYRLDPDEDCDILARFEGGFHHVVILRVYEEETEGVYVIKVPAIGTRARWQKSNMETMDAEIEIIQHLHRHTNIPVPENIASDSSFDGELGVPYIMMRRLPGVPSNKLWFEDNEKRNHITADDILEETEKKRVNMLQSLAKVMSELQSFSFDKIGRPDFINTYSGGEFDFTNPDLEQTYPYGPFTSSTAYMTTQLDALWPLSPPTEGLHYFDRLIRIGVRKVLDIIYAHPAISHSVATPSSTESFVLRHPDLDFQNILVDADGNVTGLLDWDGCTTVPRCAGYASLPSFLTQDWEAKYDPTESPYMSWQLDRYRAVYAQAMEETGCPEAKYTAKSAMYCAVMDVAQLGGGGDAQDLVKKLLVECGNFRRWGSVERVLMMLGKGWPRAEEFMKGEI